MDGVKIFWTQTAIKQRNSIFEYWNKNNRSKSYSAKLNLMIKERLLHLSENIHIGKPTVIENVRTISLGHFSIVYQIVTDSIFIIGFWDNRQNPNVLLSKLKK